MALRLPFLAQRPQAASAIATLDLTRATPRTALDEEAKVGVALFKFPQRRGVMPEQARAFADTNDFLRAALNRVKDRVSRADRAVLPIDPNRPYSTDLQARISYLLENPNPRGDSWRAFIEPVIEDLCVLGRGGWEYVANWRGWPVALFPFDARFMTVEPFWDGSNPRAPRYYWTPLPRRGIGLRNDEVTMMILNPRADRPDGLGWVDTLYNTVEADAASNEYVRSLLKKYPPPGWFHLGPNAGRREVDAVSAKLSSDVFGKGGALVTGGLDAITYQNLWNGSSRENELRAWSEWFAYKICAVAGISPQDIGLTFNINKATATVQQDVSSESGYKSILTMVQEYVNREVVGKFGTPETINLRYVYKELSARDRAAQIDIAIKMAGGVPIALWNEARAEADLPPAELGNVAFIKTLSGVVAFIGEDADAYRRQAQQQVATTEDQEAQAKQVPSGKERPTPNKQPAAGDGDGGASTDEQDDTAGNKGPKGAT